MDRTKNVRNVAILVAIAALVYLISNGERGGRAELAFEAILWSAFGLGIGYLGIRLYREHRISLHSLGDRHRAMLYGAAALGVFDVPPQHLDIVGNARKYVRVHHRSPAYKYLVQSLAN